MRSRTLERMRWLSVLCLAGAAMMFLSMARSDEAYRRQFVDMLPPVRGEDASGRFETALEAPYVIEMGVRLAAAEREKAEEFPGLPSVPIMLHAVFRDSKGIVTRVDVDAMDFLSSSGDEATFVSRPFLLSEPGAYQVTLSTREDRLPPRSLIRIVPAENILYLPEVMRMLGWLAFATGSALWIALAFARRYAPSDARR